MKKNVRSSFLLKFIYKAQPLYILIFTLGCFGNFFFVSTISAQSPCAAVAGELFGSGSFCIGEQIDIGIPSTLTDQTYTWYQNGVTKVKGPVTGNGSGISYDAVMTPGSAGRYTVVTEKAGCTSTEFGDVKIVYVGAPTGVATTAIYFDSVSFKWNKIPQILGYRYAVDIDSIPPATGTFTSDTTGSANNLIPSRIYYIHVRPVSFNGGDCEWSTIKFKTVADNRPGSLDRTFNKSGKVITAAGLIAESFSIALQQDGKILAAGTSDNDFMLVRYNADGTIDKTFGIKGKAVINLGGTDVGAAVAVQADGKIVVAGSSDKGNGYDFALVRYKTNGSLDSTFGTLGKVFTDINLHSDFVHSMAIQIDGKIIVAGSSDNGASLNFTLVRYNTNGSLDNTFGIGGKVITDYGNDETASSLAIQSDNKIVVTGYTGQLSSHDFLTVRYTRRGIPDSSFGTNGKVVTNFNNNDDYAFSLGIRTNGTIIVAGSSNVFSFGYSELALVKYTPNGGLDNTFDGDGKLTYVGDHNYIYANSVALPPTGKIIAAGVSFNGLNYDFAIMRYILNGRLDSTFSGGKITTDFGENDDYAYAVKLQPDGKILVAGYTTNAMGKDKIAIARYNADSVQTAKESSADYPVTIIENLKAQPAARIVISPNPAKGYIHISGLHTRGIKNIFIADMAGRILHQSSISGNDYTCNVKQLPVGMYYVCVEEEKVPVYLKFIKE